MCDTLLVTADASADGVTLFGKNSDREPNEAHHLLYVPASDHPPEAHVRCTYIEIPQAAHTYAVLLAKPFWIWGAEMGVNEHGVVIGNEALFTKVRYDKGPGLVGMDLLRLGLERAATARNAVDVITDVLARHGQGGNCGFRRKLFYHNSFLIADPHDGWVLETAGPHWAAKRVSGVYTISNGITIRDQWDLTSPDLVSHAVRQGWCSGPGDFDFSRCYSDFLYTRFSDCRKRCHRTTERLTAHLGEITPALVMATLRDHGTDDGKGWRPDRGLTGAEVCMHASLGPVRGSQTTGSMVAHLHPEHPTQFFTGTAAPCTSLFKPVWLDAPLPDSGPTPQGTYDAETLFWRHEALHRATLRDYATFIQRCREERDAVEAELVAVGLECAGAPATERAAVAQECFTRADRVEADWLDRLTAAETQNRRGWLHALAWRGFNRQAHMPDGAPK